MPSSQRKQCSHLPSTSCQLCSIWFSFALPHRVRCHIKKACIFYSIFMCDSKGYSYSWALWGRVCHIKGYAHKPVMKLTEMILECFEGARAACLCVRKRQQTLCHRDDKAVACYEARENLERTVFWSHKAFSLSLLWQLGIPDEWKAALKPTCRLYTDQRHGKQTDRQELRWLCKVMVLYLE